MTNYCTCCAFDKEWNFFTFDIKYLKHYIITLKVKDLNADRLIVYYRNWFNFSRFSNRLHFRKFQCKPIGLSIAKITDKDLLRVIETCVRFGKPCLIENIGTELEAALDPILTRSLFMHSGQMSLKIGENIVPYNFDFRLYLTTKLFNPHYTPEIAVKVLIVNFALTVR